MAEASRRFVAVETTTVASGGLRARRRGDHREEIRKMPEKSKQGKNRSEDDCRCVGAELGAGELHATYQPTPEHPGGPPVGEDFSRGQHLKQCPTDPITLHRNATRNELNVTGELRVDPKSCPVELVWNDDPLDGAVFQPGTNDRITVPVGARKRLIGRCVEGKQHLCKWTWTPTNP